MSTENERILIESFEDEFVQLHERLITLIESTPTNALFRKLSVEGATRSSASIAESVIRSAAAVEQTFGGITSSLWDDPFEWTLPEALSSTKLIIEYLKEAEATRRRAFARLQTDADLLKKVLVPPDRTTSLFSLLLETLVRAIHHQGRATCYAQMISG